MTQQKHLLRHGILNLVLHARGMPDTKLRALGESHSRHRMDIKPHLYDFWVDALMATVAVHDAAFDTNIGMAWREVLTKGIEVIQRHY